MDTNSIGKPKTELNWKNVPTSVWHCPYIVYVCVTERDRKLEREELTQVPTCTCTTGGVPQKSYIIGL